MQGRRHVSRKSGVVIDNRKNQVGELIMGVGMGSPW